MKTAALIAVRDEEVFLPGFFSHLRNYVDGFFVIDDGSRDHTSSIIKNESKVVFYFRREEREPEHFFEVEHREILLRAAQERGVEWVLCADADERYETLFLKHMKEIQKDAENMSKSAVGLHILSLWNSAHTYRADYPYNNLVKFLMFKIPHTISYADRPVHSLHTPWLPEASRDKHLLWRTDYRAYHLRMISSQEREKRFKKFERVDSSHTWQPVGYQHLIDETTLRLKTVKIERGFDMQSLPSR